MELVAALIIAIVIAALGAVVQYYFGPDKADSLRDAVDDHDLDDKAEEWLSDRLDRSDDDDDDDK